MSAAIYTSAFATPFGELLLGSHEDQLCLCDWRFRKQRKQIDSRIQAYLGAAYKSMEDPLHTECKAQLEAYFHRERHHFELPLLLAGSAFQRKVWAALLEVPYGRTTSYAALTESLGDPLALRAVAAANGANALSILVPCHRVLGSDGKLRGYAGGLAAKKKLLQLEGALGQQELPFD